MMTCEGVAPRERGWDDQRTRSASLLIEIEPTRWERPATRAGDVVTAARAR